MLGTIAGLITGVCSASVVQQVIPKLVNVNSLTKVQKVVVGVGTFGISGVVGNKVASAIESDINDWTGGENVIKTYE